MNPDDLKGAWNLQSPRARLTVDPEVLLREVQRNERSFSAMIFWRDVREVGISLLLIPLIIYLGRRCSLPWTWYLSIPALFWVAVFMLIDRHRHPRRPAEPDRPLLGNVEASLAQVKHQIWLLRNVFWWYILPPGLAIMLFFSQVTWLLRSAGWIIYLFGSAMMLLAGAVLGGVYWLNIHAVRAELEPRREELERLLDDLKQNGAPTS